MNVEAEVACVEQCLEELGICFCFAPLLHRAMKHVAPVRKQLGIPTIFNILGPLVNPAGAPFQLVGVGRPALRPLLAESLALLGARRALVVHGSDGLDEVTLTGPTDVAQAQEGRLDGLTWQPADFDLPTIDLASIQVAGPDESATLIRAILAGHPSSARDIVVANSAAAIWTVGVEPCLKALRSASGGSHRHRGSPRPVGTADPTDPRTVGHRATNSLYFPRSAAVDLPAAGLPSGWPTW